MPGDGEGPKGIDSVATQITFGEPAVEGLVSCIVPVYNGERFLGEALDSVLSQTYEPLEIVVVDDGSTDGTPGVAASYGERIRYVRQENAGPAAARNRGVEESRGEFIAFLDADDLWVPEKIAKQVETLRDRPQLGFCVGHVENFFMPERQAEAEKYANHAYHQSKPGFIPSALMTGRGVFAAVGGFDPELCPREDTDWFIRALAAGCECRLLPDMLVDRRLHSGNATLSRPPSHLELIQLLKAQLDRGRAGG